MKRPLLLACMLLAPWAQEGAAPGSRPKLVVMIAVDGLGAGVLERAEPALSGGLARLLKEGRSFTEAVVDHAVTVSHPGHVTLATGRHPAGHGIVDAAFYTKEGFTDAVADPQAAIVGVAGAPGASPRWIEAPTLAEWAQAEDPEARCVAVGTGRYSSLLHAGHARGDVYWYGPDVGRYVTSTAYAPEDPAWVAAFNAALARRQEGSRVWETVVPKRRLRLARRDAAPYEGDRVHTAFPHRLADLAPPGVTIDLPATFGWFAGTPSADEATLVLALSGIRARELGRRSSVDVVSVVLSVIDDTGHYYGSGSLEQLDTLVRIDRALGAFFEELDGWVGRKAYVVALSADHGMMDVPEAIVEAGGRARRLPEAEIGRLLQEVRAAPPEDRAAVLRGSAAVAEVLRADALSGGMEPYATLWRHSSRPDRVPRFPLLNFEDGTSSVGEAGLVVRLKEGTIPDFDRAVHGSPYLYDRRVPLIVMGPGVTRGRTKAPARTVDVAPTLAKLASIPVPRDLDGKPLL